MDNVRFSITRRLNSTVKFAEAEHRALEPRGRRAPPRQAENNHTILGSPLILERGGPSHQPIELAAVVPGEQIMEQPAEATHEEAGYEAATNEAPASGTEQGVLPQGTHQADDSNGSTKVPSPDTQSAKNSPPGERKLKGYHRKLVKTCHTLLEKSLKRIPRSQNQQDFQASLERSQAGRENNTGTCGFCLEDYGTSTTHKPERKAYLPCGHAWGHRCLFKKLYDSDSPDHNRCPNGECISTMHSCGHITIPTTQPRSDLITDTSLPAIYWPCEFCESREGTKVHGSIEKHQNREGRYTQKLSTGMPANPVHCYWDTRQKWSRFRLRKLEEDSKVQHWRDEKRDRFGAVADRCRANLQSREEQREPVTEPESHGPLRVDIGDETPSERDGIQEAPPTAPGDPGSIISRNVGLGAGVGHRRDPAQGLLPLGFSMD